LRSVPFVIRNTSKFSVVGGPGVVMSTEVATAGSPATAEAKKPAAKKGRGAGRPKTPKTPASHPAYGDMVKAAVVALKEKKGSSRAAILKYILQHYKVGDNLTAVNAHLRLALKRGVSTGALKQTKGTGASGSFRLGEGKKAETAKKKAKKSAAKKVAGEKKTAAKKPKSPTKAAAKPKKAKVSPKKAAAKPKKAASPKKPKVAKPKAPKKSAPRAKKAAA
uniref:Putative histone H1.6 n=2 Tax=Toxocara canis TaxID=6265 RepID=A0A183V9Z3_TOXCA